MSETYKAKLFTNGGSQAVRLPKECRFDGAEVTARRDGNRVILEPLDEWPEDLVQALGTWDEPIERLEQPTEVRDPFS